MGKLSFETFAEQWEWPGTPESTRQMLFYLRECEQLLHKSASQYWYLSNLPCLPGQERLNYLFRVIFYFQGENCFTTAAFDGKISEKQMLPGTIAVGGIGNWTLSRNLRNDSRSLSIIFMRELIRLVYSDCGQAFYTHHPPANGILAGLIENARLIAEDISNPRDQRMNAILIAICEQLKLDIMKSSPEQNRKYPENVEKAIHYIHLNFQYPINCSSVCEALKLNRTMLSGEFHQATGITMKEFILDLRLDKAKWLLEAGNMKIKDIAGQCGFNDTGYFIRVFRKYVKTSPAGFRKNITAPNDVE